jgi:hypothetical protein
MRDGSAGGAGGDPSAFADLASAEVGGSGSGVQPGAASAEGLHASSQRTVALWIGSFNASGRPRIEPSILTQDEYWLASQSGWRS